ncbi:MAG: response regulator [Crocinitomicaceae bacterium]
MSKINVLVVENESIVSKDIQHSLKKLGYNVVGASSTGELAIELVRSTSPDIVLMDIMLKGDINGIDTAKIIKENYSTPIIFITAYADEATLSKAKLSEPSGYIIKPFKEIDLHTTIEIAIYKNSKEQEKIKERELLFSIIENKESGNDFIFVKHKSKLVKLRTNEILYIEALKDYVVIHSINIKYTIHSTMKEIERKMGKEEFLRVHRSYIVRVDKIATIEYPNLTIEKLEKKIPIGGSYKNILNKRIKQV